MIAHSNPASLCQASKNVVTQNTDLLYQALGASPLKLRFCCCVKQERCHSKYQALGHHRHSNSCFSVTVEANASNSCKHFMQAQTRSQDQNAAAIFKPDHSQDGTLNNSTTMRFRVINTRLRSRRRKRTMLSFGMWRLTTTSKAMLRKLIYLVFRQTYHMCRMHKSASYITPSIDSNIIFPFIVQRIGW